MAMATRKGDESLVHSHTETAERNEFLSFGARTEKGFLRSDGMEAYA